MDCKYSQLYERKHCAILDRNNRVTSFSVLRDCAQSLSLISKYMDYQRNRWSSASGSIVCYIDLHMDQTALVLVTVTRRNDNKEESNVHFCCVPLLQTHLNFYSVLCFENPKGDVYFHVMDAPAILIGGLQLPVSVPFIWNKFVRCVARSRLVKGPCSQCGTKVKTGE